MDQPAAPRFAAHPPFAAPPAPPTSHVWRQGSTLVVQEGSRFPARCVKCNGPAVSPQPDRNIYWHSQWLYLLILAGVLVYAVVALVVRKRATVAPGLCAAHRSARRRWIALAWAGPVLGIALAFTGNGTAVSIGLIVGFLALVLGMSRAQIVVPARIQDGWVHLKGCGEPFLAGLPAWPRGRA